MPDKPRWPLVNTGPITKEYRARKPGLSKRPATLSGRSSSKKKERINDFAPAVYAIFEGIRSFLDDNLIADCLHHIMGRAGGIEMTSPYNSFPLNNLKEHINQEGEMGGHAKYMNEETQSEFLKKTKEYLESSGYKPNALDQFFLDKFNHLY